MHVGLEGVRVEGRREPMLATMDLDWSTGEAVLVAAEPGHGHTALALVATGRLVPSAGRVLLDHVEADPAALRAVSAVVDVPGVNEPDDALTLADVVAEGLALAGRRSRPRDVREFLDDRALSGERDRRVDQLPAAIRTSVLAGLAVADPRVRLVVLTLPDRHGGDPADWWDLARSLAGAGLGVLVGCTRSSARDLGVDLPPATGDSLHEPPLVVGRASLAPEGPVEAAESSEPIEPAEATEPTESAEPAEPAETAETAETAEPAEPSEPIEPPDAAGSADPAEPAESVDEGSGVDAAQGEEGTR